MPSAAGKRVGRVLAGRSKPEVGDKPGLPYWQGILGVADIASIGHQYDVIYTYHAADIVTTSQHSGSAYMRIIRTHVHSKSLYFHLYLETPI